MTVIIGYTDKETGIDWMAADYRLSGNQRYRGKFDKIVRNKRFLFGICGSLRPAQLMMKAVNLRYSPDVPADELVYDVLIPNIMTNLEADMSLVQSEGVASAESKAMVICDGKIFTIDGSFAAFEVDDVFFADGSGSHLSLGALSAMECFEMAPRTRLLMALKPAVTFGRGVYPPVKIINSEGYEEKLNERDFFTEMDALSGFEMEDEGPLFEAEDEVPDSLVEAVLNSEAITKSEERIKDLNDHTFQFLEKDDLLTSNTLGPTVNLGQATSVIVSKHVDKEDENETKED